MTALLPETRHIIYCAVYIGVLFLFSGDGMLCFALAAVSAVIFVNGWTDAPNAVACCVGSRSMRPGAAVFCAALFNFAGALSVILTKKKVAQSVFEIADFGTGADALRALAAGMTAVVIWSVFAWYFGIPTSESHALISGIAGSAIAKSGVRAFNISGWKNVGLGLFLSTLPAFLLGIFCYFLICRIFNGCDRRKVIPQFMLFQRFGAFGGAFLHGLQDGQKFMGTVMLICFLGGRTEADTFEIPFGVALFCAAVMAAGTLSGGKRIIRKVAFETVSLDPPRGVAADISSSLCLIACTALSLPVSTTHSRTCAVMGAGGFGKNGRLDLRSVGQLVSAWVMTFPVCALLGYAAARVFLFFGGLK